MPDDRSAKSLLGTVAIHCYQYAPPYPATGFARLRGTCAMRVGVDRIADEIRFEDPLIGVFCFSLSTLKELIEANE